MDRGEAAAGSAQPSFLILLLESTTSGLPADSTAPTQQQPPPLPPQLTYRAPFYPRLRALPDPADVAESRGARCPREIHWVSVTPAELAAMASEHLQQQQQQQQQPSSLGEGPGSLESQSAPTTGLKHLTAGTFEKAFFSGNPSAGLTHGLLHLMKDTGDWSNSRPSMLAMLSVPAHMTVVDLAQFVAAYSTDLQEMKVIRDGTPGQFMVLLQFMDQQAADKFYSAQHGTPFNSLEPDSTCCLAYVASIDTYNPGARFPVRDLVELPTCPVCLDRLDEPLRGVLTILCNHSFHIRCLDKWHEASCPVCRFVQTPQSTGGNRCASCGGDENLWICLICGYVGCGRYSGGHAYEHFSNTSHTFAMEVGTDRVWDYCGDNFVHRLVQNKTDGKLVQVGGEADDKLDAVTLEYTFLLTSQLENQRIFYEEQLQKQAESLREATLQAEQDRTERATTCAILEEARRDRASLEKRLAQATARLHKLQKELEDERGFNAGLAANQRDLQERLQETLTKHLAAVRKKDEEIEQLKEEMRDLYAHLEAGQQLAGQLTQDEAAGSQLLVPDQPAVAAAAGASGLAANRGAKRRTGKK